MKSVKLKDSEFRKFSSLMYELAGINLSEKKRGLIENRLAKRIRSFNLKSYKEYFNIVIDDKSELQMMINLLTTNETNFFRQRNHFEFLNEVIFPKANKNISVWSAAASNGAEGYSIAMLLDNYTKQRSLNWNVLLSDINEAELIMARSGIYPMKYTKDIPKGFLTNYCLKGVNAEREKFIIKDKLKKNLTYMKINLNNTLPNNIGLFDIIFLRNILIYFDNDKKQHIVENVLKKLKKGGYLFIGHSETLNNITTMVQSVRPTIYKKL